MASCLLRRSQLGVCFLGSRCGMPKAVMGGTPALLFSVPDFRQARSENALLAAAIVRSIASVVWAVPTNRASNMLGAR